MFNRCKFCQSKCPDYSDLCTACATIEDECETFRSHIYCDMDDIDGEIDEELEDENNCS